MTFGHMLTIGGIMIGWNFWRGWREASLAARGREQIISYTEGRGYTVVPDGIGPGEKVIEVRCTRTG